MEHLNPSSNRSSKALSNTRNTHSHKLMRWHNSQIFFQLRSVIIGLIVVIVFSAVGRGQSSFIPVQYNFLDYPYKVDRTLSSGFVSEPFIWSAANGYGQWVATDNGNWVLMSNHRRQFDANSKPPTNGGYVAGGPLGFVDPTGNTTRDIKVTANLLGDVRYVWPDAENHPPVNPPRGQFIIKGFSEASRGGDPPIDISFSGIPKPINSRDVIKGIGSSGTGIKIFPPATTNTGGNQFHPPYQAVNDVNEQLERDWRDEFDICCDGKFLYIVWESRRQLTTIFDIFVTVVRLSDGSQVSGFPKIIDQGRRPTIACNVRNNTNTSNPQITFDIAYLSNVHKYGDPNTVGGVVMHSATVNNVTSPSVAQPLLLLDPNNGHTNQIPYAFPLHARILVPSTAIGNPSVKCIYVLADDGDYSQTYAGEFLFHKILDVNTKAFPFAFYIDGPRIASHPLPLESGCPQDQYPVWNTPLIAFANPYDGRGDANYDEFHCLYSLDAHNICNPNSEWATSALHIVRGFNSNLYPGTTESRRVINSYSSDGGSSWHIDDGALYYSTPYCGSVNQMGIHVHWDFYPNQYYNRDKRAFDEPVEENTLVTDTCFVKDGTTHFGEQGTTILPGKRMTLWSDLKFMVGGLNGDQVNQFGNYENRVGDEDCQGNFFGLGSSWHGELQAKLYVKDDNTHLNVGSGVTDDLPSNLTMLPNSQILFDNSGSLTQTLSVKLNSLIDFYGVPGGGGGGTLCKFHNFLYHGKILLEQSSGINPGGEIFVHGGATLQIPDQVTLDMRSGSKIDFAFEQNVNNPWSSIDPNIEDQSTHINLPVTGKMILNGTFISDHGVLTAHLPSASSEDIITVKDALNPIISLPSLQFSATNTSFTCESAAGDREMHLVWTSPATDFANQYRQVSISGCTFTGASIDITNPVSSVDITGSSFQANSGNTINISWGRSTTNYSTINISGNTFNTNFTPSGEGIHFQDFSAKRVASSNGDRITIDGNTFQPPSSNPPSSSTFTAIKLENSSAKVTGNTIDGTGYQFGIMVLGNDNTNIMNNSFLCSNIITNCLTNNDDGIGLQTKLWEGIGKLNSISDGNIGHESLIGDKGRIIFSSYTDNKYEGLHLTSNTSKIDLSGIHNTTTNTNAFNTFSGNNIWGGHYSGQIHIVDRALLIMGSGSSFGNNNILAGWSGNDNLIYCESSPQDKTPLGGMGENYYQSGTDYYILDDRGSYGDPMMPGITYDPHPGVVNTPFSFSGISCGDGFDLPNTFVAKSAGQTPQENKPLDTSQEACDLLYKAGHNYFETGIPANDKKGYDTLRLFIESCANVKYVALCGEPWMAFGEITGNAQGMSDDNNRWLDYREWLKKVLYLNRDTMYYCEDVNSMFSTFEYWIPDKGIDYNGIISIIDFLLSTNRCPYEIDRLLAQRASVRNKQLHIWRDSVQDSLKTPIDTSAITIDSIGFSILRGQQNAVNTPTASDKSGIGWVRAERNPFNEETALIYDLETTELIKLEVFDLLGNMIYQEGGGIAQAGEHRFDLKTKSWSPGTYYARITTYHGGVKTIKLIKE